jgi:hypothetical protein
MDRILKLRPEQIALLIPVAAILTWGAVSITKLWIRHRERLAMIERGLNPDDPLGDNKDEAK